MLWGGASCRTRRALGGCAAVGFLKGYSQIRYFRALKNAIAIEMMLEVLRERVKGFFDLVLVVESG